MASDEELGITGKDVSWEMLIDGVPLSVQGKITNFTETARYDVVETKHLGTNDVDIDHLPIGWEGDFEITSKTPALEQAIDAYNAARRNRVPTEAVLYCTKRYRDGSTHKSIYRCVQFNFETSGDRESVISHRVTWTSGVNRI